MKNGRFFKEPDQRFGLYPGYGHGPVHMVGQSTRIYVIGIGSMLSQGCTVYF